MYNKSFHISSLKKIIFITVTTFLFFGVITIYTSNLQSYVDGCDSYGYPLRYKTNCELNNFFSLQNLLLDISFAMIVSIVLLICFEFVLNRKKELKKISIVLRLIALLIFFVFFFRSFIHAFKEITYLETIILVFFLLGFAQLLNPVKIRTHIFLLIGMIGYCMLLHFWSSNYNYPKKIDFKGETLTYNYSPFNASFCKLFKKEDGYLNYQATNEFKEKRAIDFFLFLQCEFYESEQNYTPKQKESIKNGSLQIIHSQAYSKGDPKEFVVEAVKENINYLNLYKQYTKQSIVQFDSIVKYRYEIFTIALE